MSDRRGPNEADAASTTARENLIFCDLSALVRLDRRTGIERVARSIVTELTASPPDGFKVEASYISDGVPFYDRQFQRDTLRLTFDDERSGEISAAAGDHYLLLDWSPDRLPALEDWLHAFRARGGIVTVVVYDLIPLVHPKFFPDWLRHTVSDWLSLILRVADNVACISKAVADDFARLTRKLLPALPTPISLGYFHLGFDVASSRPSHGSTPAEDAAVATCARRPAFLMVGTVEPRKGHAQVLEAFDLLWKEGREVSLIVVGKEGWMVDREAAAMRQHSQKDDRLFWLSSASDEVLTRLFAKTIALIVASEAEGFGLPLIEAADHGLPLIVRDIPVFREIAGEHAFYFDGKEAADAATAIGTWLDLPPGERPQSSGMPRLTWADASSHLTEIMFGTRTYMTSPARRASRAVSDVHPGGIDLDTCSLDRSPVAPVEAHS